MTEKVIIAGAGGQGIMVLGRVLAEAAMRENKQVSWLPAYGAEVRGGTANCMVVISDQEIGSPYIKKADSLIIMNEPSWERFKNRLNTNGLLLINNSLVKKNIQAKSKVLQYPFTDIAINLGNPKVANMVALGCFIAKKKIVQVKTVLEAIRGTAPQDKKELIEINHKAIFAGVDLIKNDKRNHKG